MWPEKELVELWLNRKGFFTIKDINAGSRVIDLIAIKQEADIKIAHVEVACYISGSVKARTNDLLKKFASGSVAKKVKEAILEYTGANRNYEKFLITTADIENLDGIHIIPFDKVMFEFVNKLDKQFYSNNVMRTLQLVKYVLFANPGYAAQLIGNEKEYRALSGSSREKFVTSLLEKGKLKRMFDKKENESLLIELLRNSTLKNPERLAIAMDKILTKRTAAKFLKVLIGQKSMKSAVKLELKNKTLGQFVES